MTRRFDAFGTTIAIEADHPEVFRHLDQWLPAFEPAPQSSLPLVRYRVTASARTADMVVVRDRRTLAAAGGPAVAARVLAADLVVTLSRTSPAWTFIHAGVVAVDGRAILLPGASHSGKSTLVSALLRAGAEYGSDEFAAVDQHGRVRPWARWLGMRRAGGPDERVDPLSLGARIMGDDLPAGAIVFTSFQSAGAPVHLQPVGAGPAALRMLAHCLTARSGAGSTLRALRGLVVSARAYESPRSGAPEFAERLLALGTTLAQGPR